MCYICDRVFFMNSFIVIHEHNHKEDEVFIHYCQWNGNELELAKLLALIAAADSTELKGDVSKFQGSSALISEDAVNQHIGLPFNSYARMFQKHVGTFKCPIAMPPAQLYDSDRKRIARQLDEKLYGGQMPSYFKREASSSEDSD